MHFLRLLILALICSLSLVGRSTSSPSAKTTYLGEAPGTTRSPAVLGASAGSGWIASVQLGSRSEARLRTQGQLFVPPPAEIPDYEPPPDGEEPPPAPLDFRPRFRGELDDQLLARLCGQPVKSIRPLGGGASIKFRIVLADGSQAALKPNQTRITRYQAEVAAYRLSRALGLGVVPPSCVRSFPVEFLMNGMGRELRERMERELVVDASGQVQCAVIAWVPGLRNIKLEQTLEVWRPLLLHDTPLPPKQRRRVLEISTLLLFDYLILNGDRWSGGNTTEADGEMVFIDQGAGFGLDRRHKRSRMMLKTLKWSERFSREVATSLLDLDPRALEHELKDVLSPEEFEGLSYRIQHAKDYLRSLRRAAPKDSWL
ncbi:MAG: hypothetical protein U1A78_03245 [Polyangia bacterium]